MATYTDTAAFARDFAPVGAGENFPQLVERAAVIAYNYINARLAAVYAVPFVSVPGHITDISDLLTRCLSMKLQAGRVPMLPKAPKRDAAQDDCSLAVMMLDDLVVGRSTLPGVTPISASMGVHTRDGFPPIFDVDSSLNHQPDRRLLETIESERDR